MHVRSYGNIERGTRNPHVDTLIKICEVLNVTPDDLLTDEEPDTDVGFYLNRLSGLSKTDQKKLLRILRVFLSVD